MKIDFNFSKTQLRKYIYKKVWINYLMLILGIGIYAICTYLNKQGLGLKAIGNKNLSVFVICLMFAFVLSGIFGLLNGITIRRQTYNCQLEAEDNTITYMRVSDFPFIAGSWQVGMQAWHMDEVTSVEEYPTYYLIKGKGIHVPDTRIMSDQKEITKFKLPKWFENMNELYRVLNK